MRRLTTFALVSLAGCRLFVDTIPQSSITPTAMTETYVRIGIYYETHGKLPESLDVLPERKNHANRTVDAWKRPLRYVVESDSAFSLESLGKDGAPGGVGDDSDLLHRYQVVDGKVHEVWNRPR